MEINNNNGDMNKIHLINSSEIQNDSVLHIFVLDRTIPKVEKTDRTEDYKKLCEALRNWYKTPIHSLGCEESDNLLPIVFNALHEETKQRYGNGHISMFCYDGKNIVENNHTQNGLVADLNDPSLVVLNGDYCYPLSDEEFRKRCYNESCLHKPENARTNFAQMILGLQEKLNHKSYNSHHRKVLHIFSDFVHEEYPVNQVSKSSRTSEEEFVSIQKVGSAIKQLSESVRFEAVNLIVFPYHRENRTRDIANVMELKTLFDKYFSNKTECFFLETEAYHDRLDDLKIRLEEAAAFPVRETGSSLTFYYPFENPKASYVSRCILNLNEKGVTPSGLANIHLSIHTDLGERNDMDETFLSYRKNGDKISSYPVIDDQYPVTLNKGSFPLELEFLSPDDPNFRKDISLEIYPEGSAQKKRFTLEFKEKMSKTESMIMGGGNAALMAVIIHWFLLTFVGSAIYNPKRFSSPGLLKSLVAWIIKNYERSWIYFTMPAIPFIICLIIFNVYLTSINPWVICCLVLFFCGVTTALHFNSISVNSR